MPSSTPMVSVLVPTRHEADSVPEMMRRISASTINFDTEVLFIDDSDDHTPSVIRQVAEDITSSNLSVRLLHRPAASRHGGLGGAVVHGMRNSQAPWICVIDGDLQHPPETIPQLLRRAQTERVELVVATRDDRSHGLNRLRWAISHAFEQLAKLMFPSHLRTISDPMSGFFLVHRDAVEPAHLQPQGFKILLELAIKCGPLRTSEVAYRFDSRRHGESKGTLREGLRFLSHLWELHRHRRRAALAGS